MRGEGAFGEGFGGGDGGGRGRGHDVGDYVVDADGLALGEGAEGYLDLRHGVWVGVVFGVFAEFLGVGGWLVMGELRGRRREGESLR